MDFRKLDPFSSLAISATKTRNLYPCVPRVPVQIPRAPSLITLGTYGYNVLLRFCTATNPAHAAFVTWVDTVDSQASRWMADMNSGLAWTTCVKGFGGERSMYLTLESSTTVFDSSRHLLEASPCTIKHLDCIAEVAGIWTSNTHAGLRWKLVQVKKSEAPTPSVPPRPMFVEDSSDTTSEASAPMPMLSSVSCCMQARPMFEEDSSDCN